MHRIVVLLALCIAPLAARAELDVFACEPEWAALAQEIGGELVDAESATTAFQDPHYIQARPSLIADVRSADLVVCSGAQLEIGWLPMLLRKANNRDVMPGNPGYFEASLYVQRLGFTGNVDRSQGDIHPQGNPHVQTDPRNVVLIGRALAERMAELDPDNAAAYRSAWEGFKTRFNAAIADWKQRAAPLAGLRVITHHKSWIYLEQWLGLEEVANLEPIPGLPPTAGHLSELVSRFGDGGADVIVRSPYQDDRASEWLMQRTGIPAIVLPLTVGGTEEATDLFTLYGDMIDRLLEATQ
ncbi:MAG TPA: zinc ABC transporter substrate-binding protein [Woeseiaceae bacterium]|nr:zinc ABC transporter substrate-binding protein [Woeseiaceae bacterium]